MRNEKIADGSAVAARSIAQASPEQSTEAAVPVNRLKTAVWIYDVDNARITHANAAACELWQAENEEDLRRRDLGTDMSPTVSKRLKQYQLDFIERDATFSEMWTLYPNGRPTSIMVVYRGYRLPDGRMAMQCEAAGDAENEPDNLRSAEALLHTDVMIALHEAGGAPVYLNPAARNAATHALQTIAEKFVDPADHDRLMHELEALGEYRMVAKVNTGAGPRWHDLTVKQCSDAVTGNPAILVTAIDVSELKIARDKARYLADRDQLTGCYNRSYLQQYMSTLGRYQSKHCALLCFDVDRFKQINDRLGHEMGDVVLKEIAARVNASIRRTDTFVRLGGDEFVVVFEDVSSAADLEAKLEKLLKIIAEPITHDATRVSATVSMGVATFVPDNAHFTAVMREADIALYTSKQAGRNRVTFFSAEMGALAKARDLVEVELKRAIENREFTLHFQPRFCFKTGTVISVEALVRWEHPKRGLIMPAEFISICEETGMIEDLGQLILEMACMKAISLHQEGRDIQISLNISPRQFEDNRLLKSLETFSRHPDFPRGKVELEITENVLIGDHELIAKKLEAISDMGYQIAIDDFGTGYSNLSYISRFPLNCLKIDQSFIAQLPKSGPIISLILTLAEQINATIVAEGVETREHFEWLRNHKCDQAQGYFLSHPVDAEELPHVIETLNSGAWTGSQ
ncbi:putative bifunctional diguanylate cyclase/phosphodiesterase [Roseobacter sinensis]|uniref:Bifunctional diguanylate cyclase/phosphodiesterase n=1 Tax=Roseobacter sinensis TaxID=2931391 RepID=A0ABT3BG30_9RHOB|nr:bifunctional diguanylate cyclase/phosphodiesterase [Roseobacter sp. WL0113]MCV3272545.1 bifunctional diguanylate cyclase/phosphodiesterase [Roseobacter sp. WL0113]